NVFFFKASISGTVTAGQGGSARGGSVARGVPGVTVQLLDDGGNVVATTATDRQGHYRFDNFNGIEGTGNYAVRLVVPSGFTQTSANPEILISRGDVNVSGVNFSFAPARQGTSTGDHGWTFSGGTSGTDLPLSPANSDSLFTGLEPVGRRRHG